MPSHLKERVRARMEKTGESYEQALRHVRAQEHRAPAPAAGAAPDVPYAKSPERARSVADTAFVVAHVRAEERDRPEAERLFDDPYASLFASEEAEVEEATRRFVEMPLVREGVRLRTRFIDDAVREGVAAGLSQVVLLGAGFDMRALRLPEIAERGIAVYEIDTPEQLARKQRALERAGVALPRRVAYVPFDFNEEDLESDLPAALEAKGFRRGVGALFIWEGVIGYVDDRAIDASLRFMAAAGGARSRLVFTFGQYSFVREEAADRVRRHGFASCEEIGGDALRRRYLTGDPPAHIEVMRLGVALA